MERWTDRVAVVTGASEGIGEAIVRRLAAEGMRVVALARRKELLEAIEVDVNSKHPGHCFVQVCDVSDVEQVRKAFTWIKENLGPVSVLVNNAAVMKFLRLTDLDLSDAKATFDVNIMGVLNCTQKALESIKAAGITEGHIINMNSLCGHEDLRVTGVSIYTAAKHALTSLTKSLKRELAEENLKVRVTSVSPGLVDTSMSEWYTKNNPQTPALTSEDIAEAVIYVLASPKHANVSELIIQPL